MYSIGENSICCTHTVNHVCAVVAVRRLSYKCLCKKIFFSVFLVDVLLSLLGNTHRSWSGWRTQLRKSLFVFHIDLFLGGYWLICLCWWHLGSLWICLVFLLFLFTFHFFLHFCSSCSFFDRAHPFMSNSLIFFYTVLFLLPIYSKEALTLFSQESLLRIAAAFGQMRSFIFNFPPLLEGSMYRVVWLSRLNKANWRISVDRSRPK